MNSITEEEKAFQCIDDAMEALEYFNRTKDRSRFKEWLKKYDEEDNLCST